MSTLQTIRQAPRLIRVVAAWFVVYVGLAVAAPLVQPQSLSLICSAAGSAKLVTSGDQGTPVTGLHTLDCVLCLAMGAPPSAGLSTAAPAQPSTAVLPGFPSSPITGRTAAPPPARGPPALA